MRWDSAGAYAVLISLATPFYLKKIGELKMHHVATSVIALLLLIVPIVWERFIRFRPHPANLFPYIFGTYVLAGVGAGPLSCAAEAPRKWRRSGRCWNRPRRRRDRKRRERWFRRPVQRSLRSRIRVARSRNADGVRFATTGAPSALKESRQVGKQRR